MDTEDSTPLDPDAIDEHEAREQIVYMQRLVETDVESELRVVVCEALLRFGARFLHALSYVVNAAEGEPKAHLEKVSALALEIFAGWMMGNDISDREDELDRRAAAALEMVKIGGDGVARLAAEVLLSLPEGHPKRDLAAIRSMLVARLEQCRQGDDWEDIFTTAETLIGGSLLSEPETAALIDELRQAEAKAREGGADTKSEDRANFVRTAGLNYFQRAVEARVDGQNGRPFVDKALALIDEARAVTPSTKDDFALALALQEAGELERAADLLTKVADTPDGKKVNAAWLEGKIRLRLGHYARAIELLAPLMGPEESNYLLSIDEEDVSSSGERFSKDGVNLAFAYAFANRWPDALATIDRLKSPRLRHAHQLRQTPAGKELLRLEAILASVRRGVPNIETEVIDRKRDPLGARISRQATLLEQYRSRRPDLASANLETPTVAQIGEALEPGEALVCLGSGLSGLLIGVILHGDREEPGGHMLLEELPLSKVAEMFLDSEGQEVQGISGWALELAAAQPVDPERSLAAMLANVDRAFGEKLAAFLREHRVVKATIIPHRMLHLIPFWALPSFRELDVGVASSAAQWYAARNAVPKVPLKLAAVGNPTLDLGLARIEAVSVAQSMTARGCATTLLLDREANENAIRSAVDGAGIFHFAGHGLAKPMQPLLTSLLAHPDSQWGWPVAGDPLGKLSESATEWVDIEGGRRADLPQGRLVEHIDEQGQAVERLLDYADHGTLYGRYDEGRITQLAELWSTADILVADTFSECGVAYLGACQSGQADLRVAIDEGLGLPGALQLAGVQTVISALWPISDTAGLVFAHLFYSRLGQAEGGKVDLARILRECRREFAVLESDEVRGILTKIRASTDHRPSQARLDFAISDLAEMPERPFSDPYHWAAYFTLGADVVSLQ